MARVPLALFLIACTPPPPEVVVPAATVAPSATPAPVAAPTEEPRPIVRPEVQALAGVWEDPDTANKVRITIEIQDGRPVVVDVRESAEPKEELPVKSSTYSGGKLTWTYYVPSTKYKVTMSVTAVHEDRLETTWSNQSGETGTQDLIRVR